MKTQKELYDYIVGEIEKIDTERSYLQGKRDAYTDIRLELYGAKENEDGKE